MNANGQINKIRRNTNQGQSRERGYALVGLMAVVMIAMILTTAAAPSLRREMQREKEEEMLWRGQQVVVALSRYRAFRGGVFPTDLKELVEGIDINGKRLRLLRPSAICDPMTPCEGEGETNWRTVNPGDPLTKDLLEAIIIAQEKSKLPVNPQGIQELARFAQVGTVALPGQPADTQLDGVIGQGENQQGGSGDNTQGAPIIGVVSRKSGKMFRAYYGIEEYDRALFFPNIPVMAGGFMTPFVLGSVIPGGGAPGGVPGGVPGGANVKDPRCPAGGMFVNGRCVGGPTQVN
jgi:type II secretory pathway pseudopilin PulG